MAMTVVEMLEFFDDASEGSRRGMAIAHEKSDYYLAALNCGETLKYRTMQGLLSWRLGQNPSEYFKSGLRVFAEDWKVVSTIGGEKASLSDTPNDIVPYLSYLVGEPNAAIAFDVRGLKSDRLLGALLGNWLYDSLDTVLWDKGMAQLRKPRSALGVATYELYWAVVHASPEELPTLVKRGEVLYLKRESNPWYCGGPSTEGGNGDNEFVVDYRLAALLKRKGYKGESIHAWRW